MNRYFLQLMVTALLLLPIVESNAATAADEDNAGVENHTAKPATDSNTEKPADVEKDATDEQHATHAVDAFELPEVDVVSTTPVGTTGLALKKISGNVQTAEDEEINRHEAVSLPDFMNRRMESVNINDNQNNPYQPDVTYRGFTASPLLGTPIGISVYQDGVRVNEPFGDTVNWDLIPQIAVANMEMMPGSNPLFGLNTLGGALSIRTKSGFSHPGFNAQAYGGSYGRQAYQAEYGGSSGKFDWYFAGNVFQDAGWRPYSPTAVNQGFGKVGWENDKTDLDLSFTFADNSMQGVGPTPQNLLQQSWSAFFTAPDITQNTLYFVNLKGSHLLTNKLQISGNAYNRNNSTYNLNSNTNGACQVYVSGSECLDGSTPANILSPATFQASWGKQNGTGVNLQMTSDYKIAAHENQFVLGGGYNYGETHYSVADQNASINSNLYEIATSPLATNVMITGQNAYTNIFATNTFSVYEWMHVNGSLNWLLAQVKTNDQLNPVGSLNSLNGNSQYQRLNPSIGLTVNPFDALQLHTPMKDFTTYFNYNEGFRAPTAVEDSCSNPKAPCSLPSSMTSDPPLKAVVSHTFETGMRGKFSQALKWNFAVYQTRNSNDILFVNCPVTNPLCTINSGYFQNVGSTLRQGLEFGLNGVALESLNWYVSYGFVDATYQSSAMLTNGLGAEKVTPGSHIPTIPQNTLKLGAEYEVFRDFFLGSDVQYVSSQYARGDDQNLYAQIPDYALLNLNSRYLLTKNIELFAMGRNVLDNHYLSYGQMGQNFFQNINQTTQYQGPGTVATGYAGIKVHWD